MLALVFGALAPVTVLVSLVVILLLTSPYDLTEAFGWSFLIAVVLAIPALIAGAFTGILAASLSTRFQSPRTWIAVLVFAFSALASVPAAIFLGGENWIQVGVIGAIVGGAFGLVGGLATLALRPRPDLKA